MLGIDLTITNIVLFFIKEYIRGKILSNKTKNKNEFKMNKELSEQEKKLLFNKKLLKVIISTEKNIFGRCKS